jgi:hypothetical protein
MDLRTKADAEKLISDTIEELDEIRIHFQQNYAFVTEDVVRLRMKLLDYFGESVTSWDTKHPKVNTP